MVCLRNPGGLPSEVRNLPIFNLKISNDNSINRSLYPLEEALTNGQDPPQETLTDGPGLKIGENQSNHGNHRNVDDYR